MSLQLAKMELIENASKYQYTLCTPIANPHYLRDSQSIIGDSLNINEDFLSIIGDSPNINEDSFSINGDSRRINGIS